MARPVSVLELHPEEELELERRVWAATTPRRDCDRARIVLSRPQARQPPPALSPEVLDADFIVIWQGLIGVVSALGAVHDRHW